MSEAANSTTDNNGDAGLNGTVNITHFIVIALFLEKLYNDRLFHFFCYVIVVDSGRLSFFPS